MVALYVILGVLLLIVLLLLSNLRFRLKYGKGITTLYVGVGPIRFRVLPAR